MDESHGGIDSRHPVLGGLIALVAVAAAVGLVVGIGALVVSRALGLTGGDSQAGGGGQTLIIPSPSDTSESGPGTKPTKRPRHGGQGTTSPSEAATTITLTAGQTQVSSMGHIDLSGSYPGGDGAVLTVQRFEGGSWADFPVSVTVSGGSFSTYIMTGQAGVNRFRMYDSSADEASNEVKVTVG